MNSWLRWRSDRAALLLVLILFISHLPFLTSDPDREISFSRGPFTDEGLNTIQLRNFIHHGVLDFRECDNLLKTPLLALTLAGPFLIFGTHLPVARLTVLLLVTAALLLLSRKKPFAGMVLILVPVLFFKYQVHQFSHFSLAEMPAAMAALVALYFLWKAYQPFGREKDGFHAVIVATFLVSLSWYFKIQFLYLLPLLPLLALDRAMTSKGVSHRIRMGNGLLVASVTLVMLIVYFLAWYMPFRGTYDYMMAHQSGGLEISKDSFRTIGFNTGHFLLSSENILFSLIFTFCLLIGILLLFRKTSGSYPLLFKASLLWFLLESHKLLMVYWPTRYQVSMYVSMGLLIAVVFYELINREGLFGRKAHGLVRIIVFGLIGLLFAQNALDYTRTLHRREYALREANRYLAEHLQEQDLVIGAWAPSLTWESKSRAIPVWGGFLNDEDPIRKLHPRVIVSEPDEQDSEQAYQKQGIHLEIISDSVRTFGIGQWQVNVYLF